MRSLDSQKQLKSSTGHSMKTSVINAGTTITLHLNEVTLWFSVKQAKELKLQLELALIKAENAQVKALMNQNKEEEL